MIERVNIAICASENHAALKRSDDVVGPRNRIFTAYAAGKVLDASTEERLHLGGHFRGQSTCLIEIPIISKIE